MKNLLILSFFIFAPFNLCAEDIKGAFGIIFGNPPSDSMLEQPRFIPNKPRLICDNISNDDYFRLQKLWYGITPIDTPKIIIQTASSFELLAQFDPKINLGIIRLYCVVHENLNSRDIADKMNAIAKGLKDKYQCVFASKKNEPPLEYVFKGGNGYLHISGGNFQGSIVYDYYDKILYDNWLKSALLLKSEENKGNSQKAKEGL